MRRFGLVALLLTICAARAAALDGARAQMGVDKAYAEFGASGRGVLVAVIDRGLDYEHPAFRNEDGTTRLHAIYDLTDDTGAKAEGNPHGFGTIHPREAIDAAIRAGGAGIPKDDEGRGTTSAGLACGNGRGSPGGALHGIAPESTMLFVRIASDNPPDPMGEVTGKRFFDLQRLRLAVDYCVAQAETLKLPLVMVMNFGQVGGPTDGTSRLCRRIDEVVGPGIPGRVFVSGPGDKGDRKNRTAGVVAQGGRAVIPVIKEAEGEVFVDLWYPDDDRFAVSIKTLTATFGPYEAPKTAISEYQKEFQYYHLSHKRNAYRSASRKRQVRVDIVGPPGRYAIHLHGSKVTAGGAFYAFIGPNPSNPLHEPFNRFGGAVKPGGAIWDGATAQHAICPGSYVLRMDWKNIVQRDVSAMGEGKAGEHWLGSGTGPTADGRLGIDFCVPADRVATAYATGSEWATRGSYLRHDEEGLYGMSGGTGAAASIAGGVVALILELDPTLDAVQIRTILRETARADAHTGGVPNATWGYGKLDAYAALKRVAAEKKARKK